MVAVNGRTTQLHIHLRESLITERPRVDPDTELSLTIILYTRGRYSTKNSDTMGDPAGRGRDDSPAAPAPRDYPCSWDEAHKYGVLWREILSYWDPQIPALASCSG
jgi:hypothetical protein